MLKNEMFITERLIATIAPHHCYVCGDEGGVLCAWCRPDVLSPLPSRCYSCHSLTADSAVCTKCRKKMALRHVWVVTAYDDLPKLLLQKLKFERVKSAHRVIADFMDEQLPFMQDDVIVTHAPTATSRRRQRGYDQTELIAKAFARARGLSHVTLLARQGQTRQVGATKKQRLQQMEKAFRPRNDKMLNNKTVLLIDDLTTTGSTIEAAAKVIKKAGAKQVFAATFAQKQ